MSTNYNYATDGGLITANNDYTFYDPTNASSIYISESIDAAAASLQVGVDKFETQFIEIGSSDITTTIYGAVNMTHALNVSSLSVNNGFSVAGQTTLANVSVNNLTATGQTTLANASVTGTLYVGNQTRLISETTGMTIKPDRTDSLSGNLELKTTHGSYNVPNGQGTSITDGGFTFRSTNANGTAGNNLLRIQNITTGVFTYPLVPSGTDIKNDFLVNVPTEGSINKSTEQHTFTYTTSFSTIRTNINVTVGLSYRFTFRVKKFTDNYVRIWFYPGSGTDIEFVDVGTEYKTHSYIFRALATSVIYINSQYFTTPAKTVIVPGGSISYTHFSLEPIYETTVNDLGVTGALKTNTIISTAALKINETNGLETAINSGTSIANNLTLGSVGSTTQYIRGVTVNINEYGSGNTVIGTSGGTGNITVNRPITIGYTSEPGTGHIGHVIRTGTSISTAASQTVNIICTASIPKGVWLINAQVYLDTFTGVQGCSIRKNTNSNGTRISDTLSPDLFSFYGGVATGSYVETNTTGTIYYTLVNYYNQAGNLSVWGNTTDFKFTYMFFTRIG